MISTKQINTYKKFPQYLSATTAMISMFITGISTGWPNPSLPRLLNNEFQYKITEETGSYITIISSGGFILGLIVTNVIMDIFGRKWSILFATIPQITYMIMTYISTHSIIWLYLARLISGIGDGIVFPTLPTYVCEIAEPEIRGILCSGLSIVLFAGMLFINVLGSLKPIPLTSLVTLAFPLLLLVTFIWMPQSPYFLLMKHRIFEAKLSLSKLRGCEDVSTELLALKEDVKRQLSETSRWIDLFHVKSNRRALLIISILTVLQNFAGVMAMMFYAQLFFESTTTTIDAFWASNILIIVQIIAVIVSVIFIDMTGRKPLIMFSIVGCLILLILFFAYFLLKDYYTVNVSSVDWFPLVGIVSMTAVHVVGLTNAQICLTGEIFAISIRSKGLLIYNIVYAISLSSSTKIYQLFADNSSMAWPFLIFAIFQIFGLIYCWKCVPETKGKTLERIQQMLKKSYNDK